MSFRAEGIWPVLPSRREMWSREITHHTNIANLQNSTEYKAIQGVNLIKVILVTRQDWQDWPRWPDSPCGTNHSYRIQYKTDGVTLLLDMRNGWSPVSVRESVSQWRWSVQEMLAHLKITWGSYIYIYPSIEVQKKAQIKNLILKVCSTKGMTSGICVATCSKTQSSGVEVTFQITSGICVDLSWLK